jgi:'Cold-shock' DNA-binding domain
VTAGTVKWFDATRGFGLIAPEGGSRDRGADQPDKLQTGRGALAALRESFG